MPYMDDEAPEPGAIRGCRGRIRSGPEWRKGNRPNLRLRGGATAAGASTFRRKKDRSWRQKPAPRKTLSSNSQIPLLCRITHRFYYKIKSVARANLVLQRAFMGPTWVPPAEFPRRGGQRYPRKTPFEPRCDLLFPRKAPSNSRRPPKNLSNGTCSTLTRSMQSMAGPHVGQTAPLCAPNVGLYMPVGVRVCSISKIYNKFK